MIRLVGRVFQFGPEIGMGDGDKLPSPFLDGLAPEIGDAVLRHDVVHHGPRDGDHRAFQKHRQDAGDPLSSDQTG